MAIPFNQVYVGLGGGSLLQLANRTLTQMMSYVLTAPGGELIVIDGGNRCEEDAMCLRAEIMKRGGHVSLWLFTHAHSDHVGALTWLLENDRCGEMTIGKVCFHFPEVEQLKEMGDWEINEVLLQQLEQKGLCVHTTHAGEMLEVGGMSIEVLNDPIIKQDLVKAEGFPSLNSTSVLFVAHFPARDVLFLGDFDVYGQDVFLEKYGAEKLRVDIVQMSHHGQHGVDRSFYELIQPKICLYTAPLWLWENNKYRGTDPADDGKGPFTTLETRRWMQELGAQVSCVHAFGDYLLF